MTETSAPGLVLAERTRLQRLVTDDGAQADGSGYDFTEDVGDFDYCCDGRRYNVPVRLVAGEIPAL